MPKPFLTDRPKSLTVMIPESLYNKVQLLLLDPTRARTKYKARSALVTSLLRDWVENQRKEVPDGSDPAIGGPTPQGDERGGSQLRRIQDGVDESPGRSPGRGTEGSKDLEDEILNPSRESE